MHTFHGIWRTAPYWHCRAKAKNYVLLSELSSIATIQWDLPNKDNTNCLTASLQSDTAKWKTHFSADLWKERHYNLAEAVMDPAWERIEGISRGLWRHVVGLRRALQQNWFQPSFRPGLSKMHQFFGFFYTEKCFSIITLIPSSIWHYLCE